MKKLIALILTLSVCLGALASCARTEPPDTQGSSSQEQSSSSRVDESSKKEEASSKTDESSSKADESSSKIEESSSSEEHSSSSSVQEPAEPEVKELDNTAVNLMDGIEVLGPKERIIDERFISSQMALYLTLFKESWKENTNENVLVSPLSVQLALAMNANGANGQTRSEMESVLSDNITLEELNEYLNSYTQGLPSSEKSKLSIANSIWFKDVDYFSVKDEFLYTNANYYRAEIYKAKFDYTTVNSINDWVDKHTDSMIKKALEEIPDYAVMYLINAIVFDAKWESSFQSNEIYKDTFTNASGEEKQVDMMYKDGEYWYIETDNATGFKKHYAGRDYSFVALLPNEGVSINDYIASLDDEEIIDTLSGIQVSDDGEIRMPKFSYEYEINMNDMLCELGMPTAFQEGADFSNMTSQSICISNVVHKTFISLDNEGTRAASITFIENGCESVYEPAWSVTLDRPFVYMIVDNATNLPIFIGALTDIQ